MEIRARIPTIVHVDQLDLWCLRAIFASETGTGILDEEDVKDVEAGWIPDRAERRVLTSWQGGLEWTEWALPELCRILTGQHPGWETEALVHLSRLLAELSLELMTLGSTELCSAGAPLTDIITENFPNLESLSWCLEQSST